jgi:hypothetical protein
MKIKINVTKNDIANGDKGSTNSCPVALSLRKALVRHDIDFRDVVVTNLMIKVYLLRGDGHLMSVPSKGVSEFIKLFDNSETVYPRSFIVELIKIGSWNLNEDKNPGVKLGHF